MSGATKTTTAQFHNYSEAVRWITGIVKFGIRPGLKRMELLMDRLGNPHRRLKFIHVAGTNGKGSTCAYLTNVLVQCGYSVGTFTSPYIERYSNRIQLDGKDIEDEVLVRLANEVKPIVDEIAETEWGTPTMFEVSTAIAILYFAAVAFPDFVVWETGLGGRLDSTNIVTPIVSVITNIGHDHMDILGDSLEQVAAEKAGIIKSGVPVITAAEQPETIAVIERAAREKKSTLYLMGREFRFKPVSSMENEQIFSFTGPFRRLEHVAISLNGAHQMKNAAVSLMTLEVLRQYYAAIVDDEHLLAGMKRAKWPGRLEMVSASPRILLDGAHNQEGAETLAAALKQTYSYRKLHFMLGMLSTKNHEEYLRHILPIVDTMIVTEPDFFKKISAEQLVQIVDQVRTEQTPDKHVEVIVEPDWKTAVERLKDMATADDLAVISGTLYLISDVRSWILYQSDSEKGW